MNLVLYCMMYWLAWMGSVVPQQNDGSRGYLGFDRNDYPGDAAMADLRKEFAFTGYWLTPAPGGKTNSWTARRQVLEAQGYGFVLLARGRAAKEIRSAEGAQRNGVADARGADAHVMGFSSSSAGEGAGRYVSSAGTETGCYILRLT